MLTSRHKPVGNGCDCVQEKGCSLFGPGRLGLIVPCGGIMLADKFDSGRLSNGIRNMTVAC